MKEFKKILKKEPVFWMCLTVSIALIVGGVIAPPPFVIDKSIFIAVGMLFAFATLGTVIRAIDKGTDVTFKKDDIEIKVENPDHEK